MSSPFRKSCAVAFGVVILATTCFSASPLKVCADPANLPFSSSNKTGFDNQIAIILGSQLGRSITFTWSRMGRGFVREYLNKGRCDILLGVPEGMRGVLVTQPYYRSSYLFVTRRDVNITSLDDPSLRTMKIGVQVLDDDYAPPARALARRSMAANIVGFDMEDPGAIISAVAEKKVDAAIVWGPIAGYYARKVGKQVRTAPVEPAFDPPGLPFTYKIAVGVRRSDPVLFEQLKAAIRKSAPRIESILHKYNVPTLALESNEVAAEH